MSPETKQLLDFISSTGIPGFILLVIIFAIWRALPSFVASQNAMAEQARVISAAITEMNASLHQMAEDGSAMLRKLDERTERIEKHSQRIEKRVTFIARQYVNNGQADDDPPSDG